MKKNYLQINARVQKWRQVIKNSVRNDESLIKMRVRKGIPACIRIKVWPLLINLQNFKKQNFFVYQKLLIQQSPYEQNISTQLKKIHFTQNNEMINKSLFNVLKAITLAKPEIGFPQGLSYLCNKLLYVLTDEDVFWIVLYLIKKNIAFQNILKNPNYSLIQNHVIQKYVQKFMPQLHRKLKKQNILPDKYASGWLFTLFSLHFPLQTFCRIFQCILLQGYKIVYRTVLSLLKLKQQQLLRQKPGSNINFYQDISFYNSINPNQLILIMFDFSISRSEIHMFQLQFQKEFKVPLQKIEAENKLKLERKKKEVKLNQDEVEQQEIAQVQIKVFNHRTAVGEFQQFVEEELHQI